MANFFDTWLNNVKDFTGKLSQVPTVAQDAINQQSQNTPGQTTGYLDTVRQAISDYLGFNNPSNQAQQTASQSNSNQYVTPSSYNWQSMAFQPTYDMPSAANDVFEDNKNKQKQEEEEKEASRKEASKGSGKRTYDPANTYLQNSALGNIMTMGGRMLPEDQTDEYNASVDSKSKVDVGKAMSPDAVLTQAGLDKLNATNIWNMLSSQDQRDDLQSQIDKTGYGSLKKDDDDDIFNSSIENALGSIEDIINSNPFSSETMSQRDSFVNAMQDQAFNDYYNGMSYEQMRDLGYDQANKMNVLRDLFGYGNLDYAVPGWKQMAQYSIEGLKDMNDEDAVQAIYDYMFGPDRLIDPYTYYDDMSYYLSHSLGSNDAAYYLGDYIAQNYLNELLNGRFDNEGPGINTLDIGSLAMLSNMYANPNAKFTDSDFDKLTQLLNNADLEGTWYSSKDENEEGTEYKASNRDMAPGVLLNTLINEYNQNPNLLYDEQLENDIMSLANSKGSKVVRK